MHARVVIKALVLVLAINCAASIDPLPKEGIVHMKDLFGDLTGMIGSGLSGLGSLANTFGGLTGSLTGELGSAANQGANVGSGIMNGGMGVFGNIFQQIFGAWSSIFSQLLSGGGDIFSTLFGVFKSMIENFFSILNSLTGSAQNQVNTMFGQTGTVFASVMKLKLNPKKNEQKLKAEILAAQKVIETPHKNHDEFIKALKSKAPQLTSAISQAYTHARAEFQKHLKVLNPEAKKGVQRMHLQVAKAKFDIGGLLSTMMSMMGSLMGGGSNGLGSLMSTGMSIISNLFGAFKMVF